MGKLRLCDTFDVHEYWESIKLLRCINICALIGHGCIKRVCQSRSFDCVFCDLKKVSEGRYGILRMNIEHPSSRITDTKTLNTKNITVYGRLKSTLWYCFALLLFFWFHCLPIEKPESFAIMRVFRLVRASVFLLSPVKKSNSSI